MTTHLTAVFDHGVLRPMQPLSLEQGEIVEITFVAKDRSRDEAADDPIVRQMNSARTLQELFAVANEAPTENEGYDLLQALDANRALSGEERRLLPPDA